ncbi:hypothetical protein CI088_01370 [Enterococcus plantarum]|uniref:Uncharacterized protein n=1 Tax=Enterococcus plantarum TaxID=1077675 RepID=A0A2W4BVN4_9ENTE|nr:hypothetical protein [Enterococcus plantarum]PZL77479.1 hypothetical protein CI088_01370 [Enterococcus plantarum]
MTELKITDMKSIAGNLLFKSISEFNQFGKIKKLSQEDMINAIQREFSFTLFGNDIQTNIQTVSEGTIIGTGIYGHTIYLFEETLSPDIEKIVIQLNTLNAKENENPTTKVNDDPFADLYDNEKSELGYTVSEGYLKEVTKIMDVFNENNPIATYDYAIY